MGDIDIEIGLYTDKYDSSRKPVRVIEISRKAGALKYQPQDDVSAYTCDIDWFLEQFTLEPKA